MKNNNKRQVHMFLTKITRNSSSQNTQENIHYKDLFLYDVTGTRRCVVLCVDLMLE